MTQPKGFLSADKSFVCKLNKAIYGLKQAPRAWFEWLKTTLLQLGFADSKCNPSLFTYKTKTATVYILLYADFIIIAGSSSSQVAWCPSFFLGIEVHF